MKIHTDIHAHSHTQNPVKNGYIVKWSIITVQEHQQSGRESVTKNQSTICIVIFVAFHWFLSLSSSFFSDDLFYFLCAHNKLHRILCFLYPPKIFVIALPCDQVLVESLNNIKSIDEKRTKFHARKKKREKKNQRKNQCIYLQSFGFCLSQTRFKPLSKMRWKHHQNRIKSNTQLFQVRRPKILA